VSNGKRTSTASLKLHLRGHFLKGIGQRMGIRRVRQMVIALGDVVFSRIDASSSLLDAFTAGAAHAKGTHGNVYGRVYHDVSIGDFHRAACVSAEWHRRLGFTDFMAPKHLQLRALPATSVREAVGLLE
jgi:hypothetical protein